jgi:predicted RNase H-like HicB family nuclease
VARGKSAATSTLPIREELDALVRSYHHLQRVHQEEPEGSSARRHAEKRLQDVRERLDRVLEEWVPDDELREAWRQYLEHHGPEPAEPEAIDLVVFRGVGEASGSVAVVRRGPDAYSVEIDGVLTDRVVADKDLSPTISPLRFRVDGFEFDETFEASDEALDALVTFLAEESEPPPWEYARELLADGLIDVHFAETPRGRRALSTRS